MQHSKIESLLDTLEKSLYRKYILDKSPVHPSFAQGHTGIAIFYAYFYLVTANPKHRANAELIMERVFDYISKEDPKFTFCDGIAGAGWAYQHLMDIGIIEPDDSRLNDLDDYLTQIGLLALDDGRYDFLHGGLGCGMFLLNRKNSDANLRLLFNALEQTATRVDSGIYWVDRFTNYKVPCVNFGLAHGVPSIIYFLTQLINRGINDEPIVHLLKETIRFLLENSTTENYIGCYFPGFVTVTGSLPKEFSRLAWCYGDLGVISALYQASQAMGDETMIAMIKKMALTNISRRNLPETNIRDGGLCHGSAGVAHLFNRFADYFSDPVFTDASGYWTEQLIKSIESNGGISEYVYFDSIKKEYKQSSAFLNGSAGVGLFLISVLKKDIPSNWDKFLLLR